MKTERWLKNIAIILPLLGCLRPGSGFAQMPPMPVDPYVQLCTWSFEDTSWLSDLGYAPVSFTNLNNPPSFDGNAFQVDSTNAAWLQYNIVEAGGPTNLSFGNFGGTIELWVLPDWNSSTGPGDWGRLIDVGAYSTNAPSSWWSLYFSPDGTSLNFSSETNGVFTNYLSCPIAWDTNTWHFIALTYNRSRSELYIDGQLATNGAAMFYKPGEAALTNGFFVGSDNAGLAQARVLIDDLATYNYSRGEYSVSNDYAAGMQLIAPVSGGLSGGGFGMDSGSGGPTLPGGGSGSGSGGYSPTYSTPAPDYGTNLWMALSGLASNTMPVLVSNTQPNILYEIQGCTNLAQNNWISEGFFNGSELTNWMQTGVPASHQGNLFLRIRSWQDTTGTGIPDWWWLTYFNQTINVDATASAAGDGYSNLQKFQMGLNPTNYYNPGAPGGFFGGLDASRTNTFIYWNAMPGAVNYLIQRGIQDTNANYSYSPIGLVNSNAIWFEDVGAITNANAQNNIYTLQAVFPGGSLSGTNTWRVSWYANYGSYGPPYGPPPPGNVFANVDATGTNVQISWTPAQGAATNYLVERGTNTGSYSYVYAPIAQAGTNVTSYEDVGALTNANNWVEAYAVAAVYPGGGLSYPAPSYSWDSSSPISLGSNTNAPAAPTNFLGYTDWIYYPWEAGTNVFMTWTASPRAVAYILYGGNWDNSIGFARYQPIGRVTGNSFELPGGTDGNGNFTFSSFAIVAVYADGSLSQSALCYPGNTGPAPATLAAYVDATGTNVDLVWSPVPGATGYSVQRSDYGNDYYEIAETDAGTTSYLDVDEVDNANLYGYGIDAVSYQVVAFLPNGGYSSAASAAVANTPPAPTGLTATVDTTGTNVLLAWSPAAGAVTGYIIERGTYNPATGTYNYSQIGTVGSGTTSFEDAGAITSGNANNNLYRVTANFGGGQLSAPVSSSVYQPSAPPTYNLNVTAQMVRNQTGRWQLMFSSIPTNVQTIAFYWYSWDYFYDWGPFPDTVDLINGAPFTTENDIPVSGITNGIYVLPDFQMVNWFPDNAVGKVAMIQPIGTNNQYGNLVQVGFQPYDSPTFVDGRYHMKQNLLYQLRSATISQPNAALTENDVWDDPFFENIGIPVDTNYVESSLFHYSIMVKGYNDAVPAYVKMDDVWPITVNYVLHQNLYDPTYTGTNFVWQPQGGYYGYNLSFQGTLSTIPAPAVLGVGDPYWVSQGGLISSSGGIDPATGLPVNSSLFNASGLADVAAYTNNGSFYLQSGAHNLFGLPYAPALVNQGGIYWYWNGTATVEGTNPIITIAPGSSTAITNVSCFFSQTADPNLQLASYYFAPVNTPGTALVGGSSPSQAYPLPCLTGFASTNQTGLLITSVGTPTVIGGWAKFAITNGNAGKFAYLGQYYVTNAFVITNGIVTTNTTGIVSPYGDFFPTMPGVAAMVTMPDIDTGAQGTGVVRVVSINADANHDGVMDFTYQGPDFVSASKPFRFWINDNQDSGDFSGDGIPGKGSQADGVTQLSLGTVGWKIHGRRDLVDFFPVCLNIGSLFQSNELSAGISATDTNYQFVLSQGDGALRFAYTSLTPTNYMGFLQDTNESWNLAYAPLTTISNSGVVLPPSFVSGIATNNQSIILVEAAVATTQPLVLTIYHGTNQIAQTSLPLSITGVEQMFRHKNLLINIPPAMPDRLTDASVPNEPDTIDKNFVFLHGYNVLPNEARGVAADMFKRMYWSGSHAKFYAVTWEGADTKGSYPFEDRLTPNYHTNVYNAFLTASNLATFLGTLSGTNVTAAHSLGNMVVLSAINDWNAPIGQYFMLDAAVPIEAIDSAATTNMMIYSTWTGYSNRLYASDWYQLFPTNDARSALFWNNRLGNLRNVDVYNLYSSGEEILRTSAGDPPSSVLGKVFTQITDFWNDIPFGSYTWYWQEKGKGTCSQDWFLGSSHGGWKFNSYWRDSSGNTLSPAIMNGTTNSTLQNFPMFNFNSTDNTFLYQVDDELLGAVSGVNPSTYAATYRNRILSDAIPAMSLVSGANPVPSFDNNHNKDMETLFENGWAQGRINGEQGKWHHSDFVQMAYTFTYRLFNQFVTTGNLK